MACSTSARVEFELAIKIIFQFFDAPVHKTLMGLPKQLECSPQFRSDARHGAETTALALICTKKTTSSKNTTASANFSPFFLPRGLRCAKSRKKGRSKNHCSHLSSHFPGWPPILGTSRIPNRRFTSLSKSGICTSALDRTSVQYLREPIHFGGTPVASVAWQPV